MKKERLFICLDCGLNNGLRTDYYKVREGRKDKRFFCYCKKCSSKIDIIKGKTEVLRE